jgi:hypothetical protein
VWNDSDTGPPQDSGDALDRLEAAGSAPQPPAADSGDLGKRLRFPIALERALFALVALSFLVGFVSALSSHTADCGANGSDRSIGPLILLFGGAVPAAIAFAAYVLLFVHQRRRRSIHLAGAAACSLAILELIAGLFWLVANAIGCGSS